MAAKKEQENDMFDAIQGMSSGKHQKPSRQGTTVGVTMKNITPRETFADLSKRSIPATIAIVMSL